MLSHLRFHRRGPSNPTSPIPPETSPWDAASLQPTPLVPEDSVPAPDIRPRSATGVPHAGHGHGHGHGHGQNHNQNQNQNQSHLPPQPSQPPPPIPQQAPPSLPPITRVTSDDDLESTIQLGEYDPRPREQPRPQSRIPYNDDSGFIGGLALQNYRRNQEAMRPNSSEHATTSSSNSHALDNSPSRPSMSTTTSPTGRPPARSAASPSSFSTPTDLQNAGGVGKRPPGATMRTDLQTLHAQRAIRAQTMLQEAPRGKKGLPFLKNPMSTLLARRKTSQNMPDLALQLRNYEPIRGTRVHDFSAPRPKRVVSTSDVTTLAEKRPENLHILPTSPEVPEPTAPPPVPPKDEHPSAPSSRTSVSTHSRAISADAVSFDRNPSSSNQLSHGDSIKWADDERRKSAVPSMASVSRNVSGISHRSVLSSIPKHMKSTSSRFSFDMIGAARAEKLLEERHRQRQLDKQDQQDQQSESAGHRDSRFDDFDEDAFEYDNMDFDDGLEERIPGVNADYDDDDDLEAQMDPDNDQENFAGFVFQRSNPTSAITSPQSLGMQLTPRDSDGQIIGFAMTKETPDTRRDSQLSSDYQLQSLSLKPSPLASPTGLGIQGLYAAVEATDKAATQQSQPLDSDVPKPPPQDDELYFGSHEFDGEGDGSAFDESIFDLDDTDQYGRPIPGMFANALAQRMSIQGHQKRESDDVTSRLSAQSGLSHSTAHTSLSVGVQQKVPTEVPEEKTTSPDEPQEPVALGLPAPEQDKMAAYQAALAAAAHQAVASGKLRRGSSPEPPADLTITSPTTVGSDQSNNNLESMDDYENDYDGFSNELDDYELDDDAIIAEANASALANDSDGWYGQEFNFYAGPASQPHHGLNALSEQNIYQYSNGGYFVPSGVARTKSGHIVSREPNLTPITERSEYSNRNSMMSFTMPNSANREGPLQSPGLAQLAMMADDDNMSLSALLRLRSKAWGGSQASLVSSKDGSPNACDRNGATSPWGQDREPQAAQGRKNSAFSIWTDSAAGSTSGSPTITMSMASVQNSTIPPLPVSPNANSNTTNSPGLAPLFSPSALTSSFPPVLEDEEPESHDAPAPACKPDPMSPTFGVPSQKRPGMGHRHKGSADSISYTKEDESGETRWVMERRRTAESGETEVLSRDVVAGGKI